MSVVSQSVMMLCGWSVKTWLKFTVTINYNNAFSAAIMNKAIVDYTLPALHTALHTALPSPRSRPIGDAAYHQCAGGQPSHGRRQHA